MMSSSDKAMSIIFTVISISVAAVFISADRSNERITKMYLDKGYVQCYTKYGTSPWMPKSSCPEGVMKNE